MVKELDVALGIRLCHPHTEYEVCPQKHYIAENSIAGFDTIE